MATQILNLEPLQPLSDCCACIDNGKEAGSDFEYAPIHYLPGWSSRVGHDDSGGGEGEINTRHLNQTKA